METIAEHMARLHADPEWRARMADRERERRPVIEQNRKDAAPVVADLIAAGFYIHSVADLYSRRLDYRSAIPILVKWLPEIQNPDVQEDIVRALSVKWAPREIASLMIVEYRKGEPSDTSLRWAIGNALAVLATDAVFDDVVALARDRRYGRSRERVAESLGNMKDPRALEVLLELLDDPDVTLPVVRALGRLGSKARPAYTRIEPLTRDPRSWFRKDARQALQRITRG
jgi:HEAT repeat protein